MKKKLKLAIAGLIALGMLGAVTACGDSDKESSSDKGNNKKLAESRDAARYVCNAANTALVDADEDERMTDIFKSDKTVIVCSDKEKNVNAEGIDDTFYADIHDYYTNVDAIEWFAVIEKGKCESTYIKADDNKFIGHYDTPSSSAGQFISPDEYNKEDDSPYEYDGMTFDEVYEKVVSENT